MITILYIHGFLSSPQSSKARVTEAWLRQHRPDIGFICPALSAYPQQARQQLDNVVRAHGEDNHAKPHPLVAIGSSLGGFWATYLLENRQIERAVLINPAIEPQILLEEFLGDRLKSYHGDEEYQLTRQDLADLAACDPDTISQPEKYWLMVQKGDETLDYRLAVDRYRYCRQLVEEGGSHTFDGYDEWLPEIVGFLLGG